MAHTTWKWSSGSPYCCRKGDPFQGLKVGSCLTLGNELSEEICADKARDFNGKSCPGREQEGKGTRKTALPHGSVLGFMVMGLVSRLSLASHSDPVSFLVVHALFSQRGFWEVVRHVVSHFGLSWTLLVGGGLLVLCSLPGLPVIKQLIQMVTMVPGQSGRFQSVCFP